MASNLRTVSRGRKNADWIIDLGPGAGEKGGYVIAEGTPEEIVKVAHSYTGLYLTPVLEKAGHAVGVGTGNG